MLIQNEILRLHCNSFGTHWLCIGCNRLLVRCFLAPEGQQDCRSILPDSGNCDLLSCEFRRVTVNRGQNVRGRWVKPGELEAESDANKDPLYRRCDDVL